MKELDYKTIIWELSSFSTIPHATGQSIKLMHLLNSNETLKENKVRQFFTLYTEINFREIKSLKCKNLI